MKVNVYMDKDNFTIILHEVGGVVYKCNSTPFAPNSYPQYLLSILSETGKTISEWIDDNCLGQALTIENIPREVRRYIQFIVKSFGG